jgi:hypothetical protein
LLVIQAWTAKGTRSLAVHFVIDFTHIIGYTELTIPVVSRT